MKLLRRLLVLVAFGVLLLGGAGWYGVRAYRAPGPLAQARDVVVPRGGTARVAAALHGAGVVDHPLVLRAAVLLTRGEGAIHAAEFAIPAHATMGQVLAILRHGRPVQHALTIPEGFTAAQIAAALNADPLLDGTVAVPAEGAVLPQTYAYERGTGRAALLARMVAAMDRTLATVWAGRAPGLPLDSARALLTLASIVERETGVPAERAQVAQVFLNRLRQDMRLQSDPTVAYAITRGTRPMPDLTRADLATSSPYNTYLVAGLPPTPICSPGLAALQAVAHPASGQALYFVATGTGGHAFAATLPEHEANVARYRAVMAARAGGGEPPIPSQGLLNSDPAGPAADAGPALPGFQKGEIPTLVAPASPAAPPASVPHRHRHHPK